MKALLVHTDKPTLSNSLKSSGDNFLGSLTQSFQSAQGDTCGSLEGMSSWTVISDNLAAMQNLAKSCRSGKICCSRVIVAYKICQVRAESIVFLFWISFEIVVLFCPPHFKDVAKIIPMFFLFRRWFLALIKWFLLILSICYVNYLSLLLTCVINWLFSTSRLLIWTLLW